MNFRILTFVSLLIYSLPTNASDNCFIALENGHVVKQEGPSEIRHSPYSTFKIAISLMGFDSEILTSSQNPLITFSPEIQKDFDKWYGPQKKFPTMLFWPLDQTPLSWMRYSVVWYSQYVTKELGRDKFQNYVNALDYGNKDVSGTLPKKEGLLESWLNSSLQISPLEQVTFLEKLSSLNLPVSQHAQKETIKIMRMETIWDDWKMFGKTGGGKQEGWFVGWVEKGDRRIVFAQFLEQPNGALLSAGRTAKEIAKDHLISVMLSGDKAF